MAIMSCDMEIPICHLRHFYTAAILKTAWETKFSQDFHENTTDPYSMYVIASRLTLVTM